jgi:hypothetical protein
MRTLGIALIVIVFFNTMIFAQNKDSLTPVKQNVHSWAIGMLYAENGFGLSGTYSRRLGRTTDMMFKLSVSGVKDPNEVEYYDYYGNSYTRDKVNRVFATTLNIGLKHNVFFDDIEGNFKPFVKVGVSPTFIIITPFERGFFNSFAYAQSSYGMGLYGGIGLEYYESKSIGMSIGIDYSYIQVLGREVSSVKDKNITNVGGIQFSFNFMFL